MIFIVFVGSLCQLQAAADNEESISKAITATVRNADAMYDHLFQVVRSTPAPSTVASSSPSSRRVLVVPVNDAMIQELHQHALEKVTEIVHERIGVFKDLSLYKVKDTYSSF